jgi:uncharacterized membrane protein
MDVLHILLRLIHIVGGVFWVGATIFTAAFLLPALRDAGPDGAKVMEGVARRKFMEIMPVVAILTMLSGLWMFYRTSGGFNSAYFASRIGMGYSTGGALAIIAFLIGITVVRPSMMKATELAKSALQASPEEKGRIMGAAGVLRARANKAGNIVATLLVLAACAMAVARYL